MRTTVPAVQEQTVPSHTHKVLVDFADVQALPAMHQYTEPIPHLAIYDMPCVWIILWACSLMANEAHDLVLSLTWLI